MCTEMKCACEEQKLPKPGKKKIFEKAKQTKNCCSLKFWLRAFFQAPNFDSWICPLPLCLYELVAAVFRIWTTKFVPACYFYVFSTCSITLPLMISQRWKLWMRLGSEGGFSLLLTQLQSITQWNKCASPLMLQSRITACNLFYTVNNT